MSLCSVCQRLLGDGVNFFGCASNEVSALVQSSSSCRYCRFLYEGLQFCVQGLLLRNDLSLLVLEPGFASAGLLINFQDTNARQIAGVEYFCPPGTLPLSWRSSIDSTTWHTSGDTSTSDAFACIRGWLSTCTSDQHGRCCSGEPALLPKRILDVSTSTIRLYETKGEVARYACLSHCWGTQQIIVTTSKNKSEHLQSIPWNVLSRTFQDAIVCTRRLNLQYIWIDSLCIVQDDLADWNDQAPLMAEYYSRAYVTLAATASPSGSGGLFRKYSQYVLSSPTVDGRPSRVIARRPLNHAFDMSAHPDAFPLLFRAWVYQERLLSARVLHFGPQELSWECNQALICECGYTNSSQAKGMSRDPKSMLSKLLENYVFNTGLPRIQSLWRRIVSDYSALKLTKYSDRLHAIAGLAKSLGHYRKPSPPLPLYAYGIWTDSAIADLLWHTPQPGRPDKLAAPSWSWAAVNTRVIHGCQEPEYTPERIYAKVLSTDGNHLERDNWVPQGGSGELVIEGQLVELTVVKEENGNCGSNVNSLTIERNGIRADLADFDMYLSPCDGANFSLAPSDQIWELCMAGDELDDEVQVLSLVLRKLYPQGLVFERIGYVAAMMSDAEGTGPHWYNGVLPQIVTIR